MVKRLLVLLVYLIFGRAEITVVRRKDELGPTVATVRTSEDFVSLLEVYVLEEQPLAMVEVRFVHVSGDEAGGLDTGGGECGLGAED